MSSSPQAHGRLFVVSAPSGAGKTTVVEAVVAETPGVARSKSFTSRPARQGELDGEAYHFVSRARFEAMIAGSQFLEWAEIVGNLYGTSLVETERVLATGTDLVLVIDIQGARSLRKLGLDAVSIFLMPPSAAELETRLRGRGDCTDDDIRRRLEVAREEVKAFPEYDFVVVNEDVKRCVTDVQRIILAERHRLAAMRPQADAVAATFDEAAGRETAKGV
jgi:guanylate kinase